LVAKAVYNQPHTRATMEALRGSPVFRRLCGFVRRSDIPSEATFSRAFKEFAKIGLGEKVHQALVAQWVTPELVGHISRDATAIEGREKPTAKPKPDKPAPRKQGRPRRGEARAPKPETRLERHEAARYKERTVAERFNSRLKEEFGGGNVMVRGAQKVTLHLMFGVIALFADQLLKLLN
jgi:hypothetical protein